PLVAPGGLLEDYPQLRDVLDPPREWAWNGSITGAFHDVRTRRHRDTPRPPVRRPDLGGTGRHRRGRRPRLARTRRLRRRRPVRAVAGPGRAPAPRGAGRRSRRRRLVLRTVDPRRPRHRTARR